MKTIINIKTDKEVKKNSKKIAEDLGFSLSAIINAYLRQFVRNREVYFTVIPTMSSSIEKLLGKVEIDIKKREIFLRLFLLKKSLKNTSALYEDSLS